MLSCLRGRLGFPMTACSPRHCPRPRHLAVWFCLAQYRTSGCLNTLLVNVRASLIHPRQPTNLPTPTNPQTNQMCMCVCTCMFAIAVASAVCDCAGCIVDLPSTSPPKNHQPTDPPTYHTIHPSTKHSLCVARCFGTSHSGFISCRERLQLGPPRRNNPYELSRTQHGTPATDNQQPTNFKQLAATKLHACV